MAEYIERGLAIAKLNALKAIEPLSTMADAKQLLADMPAADVAPVVHGRWIEEFDEMKCSVCRREWNYCDNETNTFNYCPNCGARMGGGETNDGA